MKNLKNLRLEKGYTHSQLADFMKIGTSVVARWEIMQTAPTLAQMIKMCNILKCTPLELYLPLCESCGGTYIPVFDAECVHIRSVPKNSAETTADFGIVLSENISQRLFFGDVCYFNIQNYAHSGDIIITSSDCFEHDILVCDGSQKDIIAVCTAVHCQI